MDITLSSFKYDLSVGVALSATLLLFLLYYILLSTWPPTDPQFDPLWLLPPVLMESLHTLKYLWPFCTFVYVSLFLFQAYPLCGLPVWLNKAVLWQRIRAHVCAMSNPPLTTSEFWKRAKHDYKQPPSNVNTRFWWAPVFSLAVDSHTPSLWEVLLAIMGPEQCPAVAPLPPLAAAAQRHLHACAKLSHPPSHFPTSSVSQFPHP